jgi:hypothetical protein
MGSESNNLRMVANTQACGEITHPMAKALSITQMEMSL